MRVNPDRQTLILASEMPLRRTAAANTNIAQASRSTSNSAGQRVTIIRAHVDAVVTEDEYAPSIDTSVVPYDAIDYASVNAGKIDADAALPVAVDAKTSAPATRGGSLAAVRSSSSYITSGQGFAFNGASAYARTQDLAERPSLIDTYA